MSLQQQEGDSGAGSRGECLPLQDSTQTRMAAKSPYSALGANTGSATHSTSGLSFWLVFKLISNT